MGLTNQWEIEQTWGSHQPVLKAVIDVLKPKAAIECGSGDFSTPHLQKIPSLHTIEHDQRWAKMMCQKYPSPPYHRWTIKGFNAKNPTRINELPSGELDQIQKFYNEVAKEEPFYDLLFVDTFTAARVPAILALGSRAEWIIVHDLEPPGPEVYEWSRLNNFLLPWVKHIHKPLGKIGKGHQIPWTGLFSKDYLPFEELNKVVIAESQRLWGKETGLAEMDRIEEHNV